MSLTLVVIAVAVLAAAYFMFFNKASSPPPPPPQEKKKEESASKGPPMKIVYGSQSGTAEMFSLELAKEAKARGFSATVMDMEEYEHEDELSEEAFIVFLMATFGEGDPTDNALEFYEWITGEDGPEEGQFEGVDYAVFALGNKQYEHYCSVGRNVAAKMREFGANEILPHGEGDDDGSLEDDYQAWKQKFWEAACQKYLGTSAATSDPVKFEGSYELKWSGEPDVRGDKHIPAVVNHHPNGDVVTVAVNRELRQDLSDGGSTKHIELDITNARVKYNTADNLGVLPRNDYKLVGRLAKRLGVDLKKTFTVTSNEPNAKIRFPENCSVQNALLYYCDITGMPSHSTLEYLYHYCQSDEDKLKVKYFLKDGKAEYHDDKKSIIDLLEELPSAEVPFADFLEWVPKLMERFYTISSSAKVHPNSIHVTVSVVNEPKPRNREHKGVCSTYMGEWKASVDKCAVFVRQSDFITPWRLPQFKESCPPVVMVGPGTGIAPFRAFLQEALALIEEGYKLGEMTLFFGCKRSNWDFIYKDELTELYKPVLTNLHIAFSREVEGKKVYVQNLMQEQSEYLWDCMNNKGGYFYVCGGTKMGRDVKNVLANVAQQHGNMSDADASRFVSKMVTDKRYIAELWS